MLGKSLPVLLLFTLSNDVCSQPLVTGPCRAYFPSFGYDVKQGKCVDFVYGGCQGNENRFGTKEECEVKCAKKP